MVRYMVHQIEVDANSERIIPFSIQLPHNCRKVVGIAVNNDAQVSTLVDNYVSTVLLNGGLIEDGLRDLQLKMRRKGIVPFTLTYESNYVGNPVQWPPINIAKNKLGSLNFRTTGQYVAELNLYPQRYRLIFRNDDFGLSDSYRLALPQLASPGKKFLPVDVEGIAKELQGWVSLTTVGLQIDVDKDEEDYSLGQDHLKPYLISITLKYETD